MGRLELIKDPHEENAECDKDKSAVQGERRDLVRVAGFGSYEIVDFIQYHRAAAAQRHAREHC